jgi:hypothetical protein
MRKFGSKDKYTGISSMTISRVILCVPESSNDLAGQLDLTGIEVQLNPQLHSSNVTTDCPGSASFHDAHEYSFTQKALEQHC